MDDALRHDLAELLDGNGADMSFDEAVADFPDDAINRRPPNVDYTPWHLLEHLRLTQADILDYERLASTPTTTLTTSANSRSCDRSWARGRPVTNSRGR